jgi:hypothetical protein
MRAYKSALSSNTIRSRDAWHEVIKLEATRAIMLVRFMADE